MQGARSGSSKTKPAGAAPATSAGSKHPYLSAHVCLYYKNNPVHASQWHINLCDHVCGNSPSRLPFHTGGTIPSEQLDLITDRETALFLPSGDFTRS